MPRNPDKTRCQVPGCHAWAMRGETRCRAHRDAELGPRGAGAPPSNLNAFQHGAYSQPISLAEVDDLARRVVEQPDQLPYYLGLAVHDIQARVGDPLLALLALHQALPQLTARLAARLFDTELDAFLQPLLPEARASLRAIIERSAPTGPESRLLFLRKIIRHRNN